jgi:phosphocarrier protein HPr
MTTLDVQIVNRLGLHARPSAKLTQLASKFASEVWLTKNGRKSIMGVMMLAAAKGSTLTIETKGVDDEQAAQAIAALIASGFEEE